MISFNLIKKYKQKFVILTISLVVLICIFLIGLPIYIISNTYSKIYYDVKSISPQKVGIVFGAGVLPNKEPSKILKDRLDSAIELYELGKIQKIIVSGDSKDNSYNEPQVMYQYLKRKDIPEFDIIRDYAGLRTYDTCIRARTLWHVDEAVLISQEYHLYRSIYTCQNIGIQSIGYSATKHRYSNENIFYLRELIALYKAYVDLKIIKPQYIVE